MNKSLISGIAAATLVGSIGLVYAQTQTDPQQQQPSATATENTAGTTTPYSSSDSSLNSSNSTYDSSMPAAQADRN